MIEKLVYVVPSPDIFSKGRCGAVSHAIGIVNGFSENGLEVSFYAEPNLNVFKGEINNHVNVSRVSRPRFGFARNFIYPLFVLRSVLREINKEAEPIVLLIRKNTYCLGLFPFLRLFCKHNVTIVAEVNGLSYESFGTSFKERFMSKAALMMNQLLLRSVNKIYCVSQPLKDSLMRGPWSINKSKIKVIPNGGPNPFNFEERLTRVDKMRDGVNFVFFGKLQPYNEFEVVFAAFEEHQKRNVNSKLIIIGDGKMRAFVEESSSRIQNCFYLGEMSLTEAIIQGHIHERTYGLVPLRKGLLSQYLSPIKLYDYFSARCPVLYSSLEGLETTVKSAGYGIKYDCGDIDSLIGVMDYCASDAVDFEVMRTETGKLYESHTWKHRMRQLLQQI